MPVLRDVPIQPKAEEVLPAQIEALTQRVGAGRVGVRMRPARSESHGYGRLGARDLPGNRTSLHSSGRAQPGSRKGKFLKT
ncbi:MAG TPA: hypothetical protein DCP08_02340 [Chloroflexi bacterium]|nr:hypothetical protein [Chloroflexota bacterium]